MDQVRTVVTSRRTTHLARTDVLLALAGYPRVYLVYAWLESMAGVHQPEPHSNADIGARLQMSAPQVARAMRLLQRLGLITQIRRRGQRVGFMVHHDLERAQRATLRAIYEGRYTIDWAGSRVVDEAGHPVSHERPEITDDLGSETRRSPMISAEITGDLGSADAKSLQQTTLALGGADANPGRAENSAGISSTTTHSSSSKSIAKQVLKDTTEFDSRFPKTWVADPYWVQVVQVYRGWLAAMGFTEQQRSLTGDRRRVIRKRLTEGCSVDQLITAARTVAGSRWHRGDNDAGRAYDDVEYVFRSRSRVEQYQQPFRERRPHQASRSDLGRKSDPVRGERL